MMKRNLLYLIALLLVICFSASPSIIQAQTTMGTFVYDDAGILSDNELNDINYTLEKYSKKNKIDLVIVTTNSTKGVTCAQYGNTFMEKNTEAKDYVVMVVCMDEYDRQLNVNSVGRCKKYISSKRCTAVYQKIKPYMSQGEYELAFNKYAEAVDYYMHHKYSLKQILIELGIALVIGFITLLCMIGSAGGNKTTNCNTYLDASHSRVLATRDRYMRTSVSKVKIETEKSSSGGSSGGGGTKGNNGGGSF